MCGQRDQSRRTCIEVGPDPTGETDWVAHDHAVDLGDGATPSLHQFCDVDVDVAARTVPAPGLGLDGRWLIVGDGQDRQRHTQRSRPGRRQRQDLFGGIGSVDTRHDPRCGQRFGPAPRAGRPPRVVSHGTEQRRQLRPNAATPIGRPNPRSRRATDRVLASSCIPGMSPAIRRVARSRPLRLRLSQPKPDRFRRRRPVPPPPWFEDHRPRRLLRPR